VTLHRKNGRSEQEVDVNLQACRRPQSGSVSEVELLTGVIFGRPLYLIASASAEAFKRRDDVRPSLEHHRSVGRADVIEVQINR
jgi:hypothetical protein